LQARHRDLLEVLELTFDSFVDSSVVGSVNGDDQLDAVSPTAGTTTAIPPCSD
jgi:hypothetical protein